MRESSGNEVHYLIYLIMQASSASSERNFSNQELICDAKKASLTAKHFSQLVFLKFNDIIKPIFTCKIFETNKTVIFIKNSYFFIYFFTFKIEFFRFCLDIIDISTVFEYWY